MDIQEKHFIRQQMKAKRKLIADRDQKTNLVTGRVLRTKAWQQSKQVGIYAAIEGEVQTEALIQAAYEQHKRVALPKIAADRSMQFLQMNKNSLMKRNRYGIEEPCDSQVLTFEAIDLLVIPGLCFAKNGDRLGYGGGYYDRYLKETKGIKMGLAFNEMMLEELPREETDIRMDLIVTDQHEYWS
ncbi:5-formyltetrahydrofolate cyclo-ligase [Aureibacillus halotolerans]|uniref:5-formyltetrahydrofolate cyclo-ligase n=1 Tax=Aureibacillus halotolerans TaxID=1508390 RepID=A0A4V3D5X4_9BACI|nr:5-formyltetrahydrofolate cyclo-ligase [Aureibacillus halotolerans]TDQ41697.1 5-formyltetrahydrofolate cyclo-ligase [Aureibacillus halotolerans]